MGVARHGRGRQAVVAAHGAVRRWLPQVGVEAQRPRRQRDEAPAVWLAEGRWRRLRGAGGEAQKEGQNEENLCRNLLARFHRERV